MSSVENVLSSDRPQRGGDAVAVPDSPAIDGIRLDPSSPEVKHPAPEPRIPADPDAEGKPEKAAIEVPVAELRALAQKSRSATRKRWTKRAVAVLPLLIMLGLFGVGATASWDQFWLSPPAWLSSFSPPSSRPDTVAVAEKSSTGAAAVQAGSSAADVSAQDAAVRVASPLPRAATAHVGGPANTELEQRIKALADSVALLQSSLDKLVATQEQTARDIASLKDAEQELRRGPSALAPQPAPPRKKAARSSSAPLPEPPPLEPAPSVGPPSSIGPPPSAGMPPPESRAEPVPRPPMPLRDQ